MTFRKDINGLRAVAVLAVVFFHFQVTGFQGGFSGVDIFFVISGYLMTGIIFTKLVSNKFSLFEFYLHRARRIIPALAVLCLTLLALGFLFLGYHEYKELLKYIKKTILFVSNISYYKNSGYFDAPAQYNWLLHTWSLSVEWQFYLIYPIIITGLIKLTNIKITKFILLCVGILSLLACIIYTQINQSASFYFLFTRAWEMIAGGVLFLFPLNFNVIFKRLVEILGLILITVSMFVLTDRQWPGYLAILPVLGTMFVIWSNQNSFITNNLICQFIGKISYSVYLWHWPIVVLLASCDILDDNFYRVCAIALSFILGAISYYFIERKVILRNSNKIELTKFIVLILSIVILADVSSKLKQRYSNRNINSQIDSILDNPVKNAKYKSFFNDCLFGDESDRASFVKECAFNGQKPSIIVYGDSHTIGIFTVIEKLNSQGSTILWQHAGCPIVEGLKRNNHESCFAFNNEKLMALHNNYDDIPVVIANRYTAYLDLPLGEITIAGEKIPNTREELFSQYKKSFINTVCQISKRHKVYLLKPIPEISPNTMRSIQMRSILTSNIGDIKYPLDKYYRDNELTLTMLEQLKKECNVTLIDPVPFLCNDGKNCTIVKSGKSLYVDSNHLTEYGSSFFQSLIKHVIFNK